MKWLFKRLTEPSTGIGVAILSQLAKTIPDLAPWAAALDALTASAAAQAVVAPEAKNTEAAPLQKAE